jgi:arylsulfatase A-like enzyme
VSGEIGDTELANAHLFDIAPTVLASIDVASDETMDGRLLAAGANSEAYPEL